MEYRARLTDASEVPPYEVEKFGVIFLGPLKLALSAAFVNDYLSARAN